MRKPRHAMTSKVQCQHELFSAKNSLQRKRGNNINDSDFRKSNEVNPKPGQPFLSLL